MVSGIKRQVGLFLMLTGLLHTVVGLILYMEQLQPIVADGLWNTVAEGQWERMSAFWFMMFGFMLIFLGYTADWLMKKKGIEPPAAFGWMLLAVCLVGVVVMPASGFWIGLPQAWMLLRQTAQSSSSALSLPEIQPLLVDADYIDVTTVIGNGDLRTFLDGWFNYRPVWLMPLLGMRHKKKVPSMTPETVPLQVGKRVGILTVRMAEEERYWIAEIRLKHLKATLGVVVEPLANQQKRFSVLTVVQYSSWAGPIYFQLIKPFHRLVAIRKVRAGVQESGEEIHQVRHWRLL